MRFTRKRPMASPHLYFLLLLLSLVQCASANDILLIADQHSHDAIKHTPLGHLFADSHFETNENDSATFRVLTADTDRWEALGDLGDGVSLQVQRSNHFFNITIVLLQTYVYQMHPADAGFLYDIIRHSNAGVVLLQSGEKDTTEFNKIVQSAANCTHRGKLLIDIAHTVYFCNYIEVSNIPLYDSAAIEELSADHENTQSTSGFFVSAIPSAHNANEKVRNAHLHIHILKHRKKRVSKAKIAQISLHRKHSIMMARRKYLPANLAQLSMSKRRIPCKYRKSCYITGEMPFYTIQTKHTGQLDTEQIEAPDKQLSELEIKVLCKYRKSCYDQIGAGHSKRKSIKAHRVLAGKSVHMITKPKKRRTLKEIAEIALKHVEEQEKRGAQRPKPKMIIVEAKLNQIEEKRAKQLRCKYRKSCYETGVRPLLDGESYLFQVFHFLTKHVHTPGEETLKNVTFDSIIEQKRKLFCKYRKSCYETGEKPEIDHKEKFKYQHMMEKHEAEIPLQIKCHYRKSCYETGKVPELRWSKCNKIEEQPPKDAPRTVIQLKLNCKYRKSCYLQHVLEQAQLEEAAISQKQIEPVQEREVEPTRPSKPVTSTETKKEITESLVNEHFEQKSLEITPTTINDEIHEEEQKEVSKKTRISAKKKPKQEAQPLLYAAKTTPAHERTSKKYHIILSNNETVPGHVRKRHLKHRIEQLTLQRRHARLLAKRKNTIITQLPESGRKLLCKYRKSCYETGVLPMFVPKQHDESEEVKEFSEAELKVFCKYRKSCYDEIGTKYERLISGKHRLVLAGKGMPIAQKQRKKRSVKEMAEIALQRAHKKQERVAQKPQPKMAIVKAQLNKIDEDMHRKLACKYRKSCYKSGIRPIIEYDNFFIRTYRFLSKHVHTPGDETIFNATFTELDIGHKKLFCKYRKSCYESGVKPHIENEERFKYKHVIEKQDVEIPLEIKCHYRKSCYETGIVPDLRGVENVIPAEQPPKKAPATIAELKLHCRYRKSCYLNKTVEQPELETAQQPHQEEKRRIVLPPVKPAKELKPKTVPEIAKVRTVDEEKKPHETKTVGEESAVKETVEEAAIPEETTKPSKTRARPAAESVAKTIEDKTKKQKPTNKDKKKPIEIKPTAKDKKKARDTKPMAEISKKSTEKRLPEKKEKMIKANLTDAQPVSAPITKEEKVVDKREQKKEKQQKPPIKEEKPVITKPIKKDRPSESTVKSTEAPKTKPTQPKAEKDKKKEKEVKEEIPKMDVKKPIQMQEKPRMVPHKEIRFVPPPTPPSPEEEVPPFKAIHIEGDVETLEEKLRCKYRKSCYHNRTLPNPFDGFKIEHITKKEEQHIPMQYRCKYRKSCYETGEIPHTAENFKVEHLVVKKEEHIPLSLRCKYRKSCYETGIVPNIDQEFFIVASFQNFMREFYEETEEIRREMSEEERKLSCKYRKSCYETGKLPEIQRETIKTIADTMKETTLSLHLRCKYRKSCYANYGIPFIKDTKRMPKREAVIEKPSTSTVGEQAKVKTTEEQRKPHPPTTVDESDKKKTTKKSKKSEKEKRDSEEELPYMQIVPSEEKKPRTLSPAQKLKCKYRIKCYEGVPIHKMLHELRKEPIPIKSFQRADGRPCTIYHLSCRRMAGLPIKQRAPIGPNGRRLCRKKPKAEAAAR